MKKSILIFISVIVSITLFGQSNQQWQYLGRLSAYYGEPDSYTYVREPHVGAQLYSSFDGEKITYKLVIGQEVYPAIPNPDFSLNEYEEYLNTDFMHRVDLPNKKKYSHCAGKYRFNPSSAVLP